MESDAKPKMASSQEHKINSSYYSDKQALTSITNLQYFLDIPVATNVAIKETTARGDLLFQCDLRHSYFIDQTLLKPRSQGKKKKKSERERERQKKKEKW